MLNSVERYEMNNLKDLITEISEQSFAKIEEKLADPTQRAKIQDDFFASALVGLRKGVMEYDNDPLLPILQSEIKMRTSAYQNLTAMEE